MASLKSLTDFFHNENDSTYKGIAIYWVFAHLVLLHLQGNTQQISLSGSFPRQRAQPEPFVSYSESPAM